MPLSWWRLDRAENAGRQSPISCPRSRGLCKMAGTAERGCLMDRCKDCGANLSLVGSRHNCRPRAASPRPSPEHMSAKDFTAGLVEYKFNLRSGTLTEKGRQLLNGRAPASHHAALVPSKASPHAAPSPHAASPHKSKGAVARNLRWRAKNLDHHRQYHAAYMRSWRARTAQKPRTVNTVQELRGGHRKE